MVLKSSVQEIPHYIKTLTLEVGRFPNIDDLTDPTPKVDNSTHEEMIITEEKTLHKRKFMYLSYVLLSAQSAVISLDAKSMFVLNFQG